MLYLYPSVSGFLQMQSSLSKKLPADRAFGSIRRARRPWRPLRSAHASALALRGRLRAKSRAFSAIVRKGGTAPTRACGCGPPPLFGGIRRVACTLLRKDARLCHRHLFPGRFFYFFTFFNSLFRRCGFQLAFSLHLKFLNTTRFDFSIGSLPPFTSSF